MHWPLLFILNHEDAPSAQTLDLPPTSTTKDCTLAKMVDVQAGLDRALVPHTGPPKADGSADLRLGEMADTCLVPLLGSDSKDDLRGNNVVPLGVSGHGSIYDRGLNAHQAGHTTTLDTELFRLWI